MKSIKSYVHKLTILLNLQDGMQNLLPCSQTIFFFLFFLYFSCFLNLKLTWKGCMNLKEQNREDHHRDQYDCGPQFLGCCWCCCYKNDQKVVFCRTLDSPSWGQASQPSVMRLNTEDKFLWSHGVLVFFNTSPKGPRMDDFQDIGIQFPCLLVKPHLTPFVLDQIHVIISVEKENSFLGWVRNQMTRSQTKLMDCNWWSN